jgi:hypothetical protein
MARNLTRTAPLKQRYVRADTPPATRPLPQRVRMLVLELWTLAGLADALYCAYKLTLDRPQITRDGVALGIDTQALLAYLGALVAGLLVASIAIVALTYDHER